MPYLGNEPAVAYTSTTKDSFSGDGSTTDFTMSKSANVNAVRVVVENVVQNPTVAYTCSGTTIAFTSAPPTGTSNIYVVHLGPPAATVAPPTTINNATTFTADLTIDDGADIITASKGTDNVRLGEGAGTAIESGGNQNVTIGKDAGAAISTGDGNIAIGYEAGNDLNTGSYNIGIGWKALDKLDTGSSNVAVGDGSMGADTKGQKNVAIGSNSLNQQNFTSATDSYNIAVGYNAGQGITTGAGNTLVGGLAGDALSVGSNNIAVGYQSLSADTKGNLSVAMGQGTLLNQNFTSATNTYNTALGHAAGNQVTTGYYNTFVGGLAGDGTNDGNQNVAVGIAALSANCDNDNTAVGAYSLQSCTGAQNTCVGSNSGVDVTSGGNLLLLGKDAGRSSAPGGAHTTGSNSIVLGDNNVANAYIKVSLTVTSDERDKTDFTALDLGLDFVKSMKPYTFKWDQRSDYGDSTADDYKLTDQTPDGTHKKDQLDVGFKAQDIEALEKASGYKISDKTNLIASLTQDETQFGLKYSKFIPILTKAIQELSAKVDALETENTAIKARLDALEAG